MAQQPDQGVAAGPADKAVEASADTRRVDINEYVVRGNTVLDARSIEKAVTPFLGPQRTMKDVEGARDALLAAYNAKGYQSVYVDLPEQQVTEGVVFLQVSETTVGRVRVVGAQYNSPLEVREQVPSLKEGAVPDFTRAQAELTALNRGAKRQVVPLVKQGSIPGTMDVDLKVDDSSPWRASVGVNNDYSADTKPLRMTGSIGYDNLWQMGHSASISYFGTPQDMSQTRVWSGSYSAPIRGTNWTVEGSGFTSNSNVATVGGTSVLGKGHSFGIKATYTVPDTGNWYHAFGAGVDFKKNDQTLSLNGAGDTVPLKYAPVSLTYAGFMQGERNQYGLNFTLLNGTSRFFGYGSSDSQFDYNRYKATSSFMVLKLDLNGTHTFSNSMQLGGRLNAQITDSPLVSGEQIAAGGLNSVRGYLSAEATGDYGAVGSVELRSPLLSYLNPVVENWRIYTFLDAARLKLRDPLVEQIDTYTLASVGFGSSFLVSQVIGGRVDFGYPLKKGPRTDSHTPRLNFSLTATY
ncbi:ShlB/FhaC/HecB family hemolysin secretion/activation protein [Herbaspirillum chlorophenolicum]|uniref:ShlB/FhaC/HecB family hemolysin secretion/activation protein n=1 Tax=Herbaspirillum chlorophenolicum TaxID=211589 RepID=UPI000B0F1D7A|nr:ShlB/FhaC/HecB family hemolysin secretion/activation protein [Herbaspirillum chlorophenolicum]